MIYLLEKIFNILKQEKKSAVIYALEAETYRHCKKYSKALKSIKKAIKKEPSNDMFFSTESNIYFDMKKYDLALKSIDKALKIQPQIKSLQEIKEKILKGKNC